MTANSFNVRRIQSRWLRRLTLVLVGGLSAPIVFLVLIVFVFWFFVIDILNAAKTSILTSGSDVWCVVHDACATIRGAWSE